MAHHARLDAPADPKHPERGTVRQHLAGVVARKKLGSAALDGPECPESLDYLLGWANELARARTAGWHGVNGFTYEGIASWARLTKRRPSPMEVEALFAIDATMRYPGEDPGAGPRD